jgi:sulfite oxidase
LLKIVNEKPFNAETPTELSVDGLVTPNELHFKRNHLPVPIQVNIKDFKLEFVNDLGGEEKTLTIEDLKTKFPIYTIPVTIQCAGNRRKGMHGYKPVQGLMWGINAISTAEWTGVKLKDVLEHLGIDIKNSEIKHVQFVGLDNDPTGASYGASIPIEKVISDYGDVLIAFEMNGVDIPVDHGYPLRVVVPGVIGARSVKWLKKIVLSKEESKSHWQQKDYKLLSPTISNLSEADFSKIKSVQECPVQSSICEPLDGAVIKKENEMFNVKGYAFSGGGNSIETVLVSLDDGKTWKHASLKKHDQPLYRFEGFI